MVRSLAILLWLASSGWVSSQEIGPNSTASELAAILLDEAQHLDTRLEAIRVLSSFGDEARAEVGALVDVLLDAPSSDLRSAAAVALRELGPLDCRVVPALTLALRTPHPTVRLRSAEAFLNPEIAALAERAVGALARMAYRDDRPENRAAAFASMAQIAEKPPILLRLLRRGLLAPGIPDRVPYVELAMAIEAREASVVDALAQALDRSGGAARFAIIESLGLLGRGNRCAFEALEACLLGPGRSVRIACMDSILLWGSDATMFLPALDALILVEDPQVRSAAMDTRSKILTLQSNEKP